ncbi:MAG: 4a-hydroxytetrahydrobiopterin dehydratase [Actinobacteria bacterium]|jgi:4a-hydroxytetrahydrobiopterin dehydratase|nr:4a-hydroxytetrahydrobiopterin dehydratase [Actinomycetota bacterium]
MKLHQKKCVPCRGDIPPFTKDQIDEYLKFLSDWKVLINEKKAFYLSKAFKFKNFEESLGFINKLSQIAEEEGHHPDLKFGWGYAEVNIYTHAIKGLSLSDFILASKIDMISV